MPGSILPGRVLPTWRQCTHEDRLVIVAVVVQSLSRVRLSVTPWTAARVSSVLHHLPELSQTHVHRAGDAIQPYHSQSSPSPAFNLSQHQNLF